MLGCITLLVLVFTSGGIAKGRSVNTTDIFSAALHFHFELQEPVLTENSYYRWSAQLHGISQTGREGEPGSLESFLHLRFAKISTVSALLLGSSHFNGNLLRFTLHVQVEVVYCLLSHLETSLEQNLGCMTEL
jgi:hypothetical protein